MNLAYPAFTYEDAQPGFAEHDMEEYNKIAADLSWSRTIKTLRKGFSRDNDIERRWEEHQDGKNIWSRMKIQEYRNAN